MNPNLTPSPPREDEDVNRSASPPTPSARDTCRNPIPPLVNQLPLPGRLPLPTYQECTVPIVFESSSVPLAGDMNEAPGHQVPLVTHINAQSGMHAGPRGFHRPGRGPEKPEGGLEPRGASSCNNQVHHSPGIEDRNVGMEPVQKPYTSFRGTSPDSTVTPVSFFGAHNGSHDSAMEIVPGPLLPVNIIPRPGGNSSAADAMRWTS